MLDPVFDLADAMKLAARSIGSPNDLETTLAAITTTAVETIPGVNHASISVLDRHRQLKTLVPTDGFVADATGCSAKWAKVPAWMQP
jgi:hypothetical protein